MTRIELPTIPKIEEREPGVMSKTVSSKKQTTITAIISNFVTLTIFRPL